MYLVKLPLGSAQASSTPLHFRRNGAASIVTDKITAVENGATLTFLPQNVTVRARAGDTILDAALDNRIPLEHECGGNCACTTCHVKVVAGAEHLSAMEEVEAARLTSADDWTPDSRLGCQAILQGGNVVVEIVGETN